MIDTITTYINNGDSETSLIFFNRYTLV